MKQLKILAIGEHPLLESGFSAQFRGILGSLYKAGHEIHAVCWVLGGPGTEGIKFNSNIELDYEGKPKGNVNELPYITYPLTSSDGSDYWGIKNKRLINYANGIKPDVIFSYGDPHMLNERGLNVYNLSRTLGVPLVTYVAIDCAGHQDWVGQNLQHTEYPVLFTHWAKGQLEQEFPYLDNLRVILHGVKESYLFGKEQKALQRNLFKFKDINGVQRRLDKDIKVCLTVARNCERKGFDALLKAYKKLREKRQDFIAILHTQPRDFSNDSVDLDYMVSKEGLSDYVIFSQIPNPALTHGLNKVVPWDYLQTLYGISDVNVIPSKREGFGLSMIEAAMSGIPSIGTDYASMSEILTDNRGWLVPLLPEPYNYQSMNQWGHKDGMIDIDKLVDTLDYVLDNPKERNERAANIRKWVIENCSWENIGQQWVDLFDAVAKDLENKHLIVLGDIPRQSFATYYADFKHPKNPKTMVALNTIVELERLGYQIEKQDISLLNNPLDAFQRNNNCIVHGMSELVFAQKINYEQAMDLLKKKHKRIFLYEQADTSSIDKPFVDFLNDDIISGILTPSEHSKDIMQTSGVVKNIYAVGHGVRVFEPSTKFDYLREQYPDMKTVLMFTQKAPKRKGLDLNLRLCSFFGYVPTQPQSKSSVLAIWKAKEGEDLNIQGANFPILQVSEWLSPNDLASLYKNSDIFMSLHRNGAFEQCPMEAIAYGIPSIITGYGSVLEYAPREVLIEPITYERINAEGDPDNGDGANADMQQAVIRMKYIMEHYDEEKEKAEEYSKNIMDKWTWEVSAHKIVKALEK